MIGNFNNWTPDTHSLFVRLDRSGIWEGFIPQFHSGEAYKYHIHGYKGGTLDKGDPYAYFWEMRPRTASITWELDYDWQDRDWMSVRKSHNSLDAPWSIYEVHLASWMRPDPNNEELVQYVWFSVCELLVPYVKQMGFTHVELMPVMEHPFDGSWGYQGTGYYAPTSRFGDPQGFMALVEAFHQAGIGVILDWVPSHFPYDYHGLYLLTGPTPHEDSRICEKHSIPIGNSYIFNYKRGEVKSFLISNARYWIDRYHIDGIRVDAVSSMLKLNYSRKEGEWEPNEHGGDGNLEAIDFIKDLNQTLFRDFPDIQTIAEEATDWPGVSRPTFADGLGFGMKWMMGWMHDTLDFFKLDPILRGNSQDKFTFSLMYYYDENFVLPLSHDEVVHGKSRCSTRCRATTGKRLLTSACIYTYMMTHPGGKLLFMGNEFGSTTEWNYKSELPWNLLQFDSHRGIKDCYRDLNHLLTGQPALYENQFNTMGFDWVDLQHRGESIVAYRPMVDNPEDDVLIILNFTPVCPPGLAHLCPWQKRNGARSSTAMTVNIRGLATRTIPRSLSSSSTRGMTATSSSSIFRRSGGLS